MAWLAAGVVAWRIAAALNFRSSPLLGDEPSQVDLALLFARGFMGLAFAACGMLAFLRSTHPARTLFALYALCAGLHWGGPIGGASPLWGAVSLLLYLTVSGMLAQSFFLHFTLAYPRPRKVVTARWAVPALYLPAVVGALLAAAILAAFELPGARDSLQGVFLLLHHLQSNLFGLAGLVLILITWCKASTGERARFGLGWIVLGAWGALLPWGVATVLGREKLADVLTLLFILIPVCFCAALLRDARLSEAA